MNKPRLVAAGNANVSRPCALFVMGALVFLAIWSAPTTASGQTSDADYDTLVCTVLGDGEIACSCVHGPTPPQATPPPPPPPPCGTACGSDPNAGLAGWRVSEPSVNLWLTDTPLLYPGSRGRPVRFLLYYKNREGTKGNSDNAEARIFSLGSHWHSPWRSYLEAIPTESTNFWVYFGDGSAWKYTLDKLDYATLAKLTQISSTNVIQYRDGSSDVFGLTTNIGGVTRHFLTRRVDLYGNTMAFQYLITNDTIRLDKVIDVDNRSITFEYTSAGSYSNVITKVIAPHGLTNVLQYDSSGRLTNITDSIGLRSQMQYDTTNLTALLTPYGTTTFNYFSISNQMDAVKVTELGIRNHFYLYYAQVDGGKVPANYSGYVPSTTNSSYFAIANTFDQLNSDKRNTFRWGPRQYETLSDNVRTNLNNGTFNVTNLTTSDYIKAQMKHWLKQTGSTNPGITLSLRRDQSPNGVAQGQVKWFDHSGKPAGVTDEEGTMPAPRFIGWKLPSGESRFTYSERNVLSHPTLTAQTYTGATTCLLRTNQYEYGANNVDLTRHVQLLGATSRQVSSNVYNSSHSVLTNLNALGEATVYAYNANQQIVTMRTPAGLTRSNVYDSSGTWSNFLTKRIELEINSTNSYTISNGHFFTHTDAKGLKRTHVWDGLGRRIQTLYPDGTSSTLTYTNLHLLQSVNRLNQTNKYTFDGFRQLTQKVDPRGSTNSYSYCSCGTLDSGTDGMGKITSFIYDQQNRRCATLFAGGGAITNNYDLMGWLTNVIDSGGCSVTNCFNNQGLVCVVSNAFGCPRMIKYDIEDHWTNVLDANSVTIDYTYDDLGRQSKITDGNNQSQTFTYSSRGLIGYTNQAGESTCYQYDAVGRKLAETNAVCTNTFTYNASGLLLKLMDGKGNSTSWGYDAYGRVTSKTNAAGTEILRYTYDAMGRLTNRWSLAKGNTRYSYDLSGNLINIDYPSSPDITMQYDGNNRLTNMVDAVGNTTLSYTDFGALLSEDGPWADDTVSYSYTSNRLRSKLTLLQPNASAWEQTYAYDSASRLTTIASPAGAFPYDYDPNCHLHISKLGLPNTSYITNSFDSLGRLTGTYLKNSSAAILNSHTYAYDSASRRTRQTRTDASYVDYGYDGIGQLKTATGKESGGATNRWHEQMGYAYDAAGNLTYRTNNALIQTLSTDNQNQLTSVGRSGTYTVAGTTWGPATNVTLADNGNPVVAALRCADNTFARTNVALLNGTNTFTAVAQDAYGRADTNTVTAHLPSSLSFSYDGNGNLTTNGTRFLEYDDENQLIRVTEPNAWKSEFSYDGRRRRRVRVEFTWNSSEWVTNQIVCYVYDGNSVIQERDQFNLPQVTYTSGRDLSGSLQGAGGIGGLLARTENPKLNIQDSAANAYYQADGNGNVSVLVSANQRIVAKYLFDPFGNTLAASGTLADANLYRFSSKECHPASGLIYYLYRFYNPNLQRWLSRDPLGERAGVNLHTFLKNNPISHLDLFGLDDWQLVSLTCQKPTDTTPGFCFLQWAWLGKETYLGVSETFLGRLDIRVWLEKKGCKCIQWRTTADAYEQYNVYSIDNLYRTEKYKWDGDTTKGQWPWDPWPVLGPLLSVTESQEHVRDRYDDLGQVYRNPTTVSLEVDPANCADLE